MISWSFLHQQGEEILLRRKLKLSLYSNELETYGFDIQLLGDTHAMIEQNLGEITINHMNTLKVHVKEQEIYRKQKSELDAIRAKVEKPDDFVGF